MAFRLAVAIALAAACSGPNAAVALRVLNRTTCGAVTDRGAVDLSRLSSAASKKLFTAYNEFNSTVYLWSPCVDYDIDATQYEASEESKPDCRAFAMLQYDLDTKSCVLIGSQSSAEYTVEDDRLVLTYGHGMYKVKTIFQCSENDQESWKVTNYDIFEPTFTLTSAALCLDDAVPRSFGSWFGRFFRSLPGYGTLVMISLAIVACLYVMCGVTYNRLKYRTKLRDSLPNHDFWYELPYLIRDGARFVVCRYKKRQPYSKIRTVEGKDDDGMDKSSSEEEEEYDYAINPRASVPRFKAAAAAASHSGGGSRLRDNGPESVALLHKPRNDVEESRVDPVDV